MNCFAYEKYSLKSTLILRKYIVFVILLIFVKSQAQVTHFPGVQHGYDIGFGITVQVFENAKYVANAANKNRLIVFLGGSGETDSTTLKNVGWSKRVGSLGWNGKQYISSTNDTAYYTILSVPTTGQSTDIALNFVMGWFFTNWTNFDTSVHANFNLTGLSAGAGNAVGYRRNYQGNFGAYANIFQNLVLGSVTNQDVSSFPTTMVGVRAKMYEGLADTVNGCCNPINSTNVYNAFPTSPPYKQLTMIPGAGHDATVWDSMTSPTANTAARNSAIWMADPYVGVDTDFTKFTVLDDMESDNGGCDGRTCTIMGYFNQVADPAHGVNTVDTVNGDIRGGEPQYRYQHTRVIELNLQKEVWGKRLYGYQLNTSGFPDTLDIYLSRTAGPAWFKKISESLRDSTPNYRIIQDGTGSAQWKLLTNLNDTFQHVIIMIRYQSFFTTFPIQIQSGYSDFILYAKDIPAVAPETTYNYISDAAAQAIADAHHQPFRNFNGTNHGNDDLPHSAYAFSKFTRMYRPWIYYQDSVYNHIIQTAADFASFANWCDTLKLLNSYADIYAEITGPSYWTEFKQFGHDTGYSNPSTDTIGIARNLTRSYKKYSQMLYGIAAMYFHGGDTSLFTAVGGPKPFHAGIFSKVQINNEDDDWNFPTFANLPTDRVQRSRAAYDGDGNTMGAGAGFKNADPTSKIIYGAFVGWNYRPMLTTIRFAQYAAGSRVVPWDIMAGHIYFSNLWENPNLQQTDRVGTHGVFPGQHYSLDTLAKMRFKFYKTLGYDMDFYLDEVGWDRTFQYPVNTGQLFSVTSFGLPHIGVLDSNKVQGICLTASQLLLWRNGYDAMVQFQGTNANNIEGTGPFERSNIWLNYFHTSGGAVIYDSTHFYEGWYMMNGLSNRMGDYIFQQDVIAPTDGGKYIFKGRKPGTDSVCYVVGVTDTLNTGQAFSINLSNRIGNVNSWTPSYTIINPGDSPATLSGNTLNGTAFPLVQIFFLREQSFRGFILSGRTIFFGH